LLITAAIGHLERGGSKSQVGDNMSAIAYPGLPGNAVLIWAHDATCNGIPVCGRAGSQAMGARPAGEPWPYGEMKGGNWNARAHAS